MKPLNTIKSQSFIDFIKVIEPRYEFKSYDFYKNKILSKLYDYMKNNINDKIKNEAKNIFSTVDYWTSI